MKMSGFYGIDSSREVIRVHVKKCDGMMQPETKKFSIDPQITSFEMLQNLLAKAFDIQSDFTISYLSQDGGQDVYLSMLSDWDMDAAFQNASDPCLKLKVDLKPFDDALEDWDIIAPVEIPQYRMAFLDRSGFLGNITGTITNKVERTVSHVQRVIGMKSEDEQQYRPVKTPMTDMEFRNYLDSDGHMVKPEEFRLSIYQGGIEPSLRRVVWRHLLNIYPKDMSGRERFDYMKKKEKEYFELRDKWRKLFNERQVSEEAKHVATLVKKDVLRTDRTHKYYSGGDDSKNLIALYNLLVTYALAHPEVSYCQGMSDIASPLLVVQKEEAQAYLCFCGLMKRLRSNFMYDGEAITTKLQHLSSLVKFYDPVFHAYMKDHGAEDMFFCYRWLLLEMKREFPFDDALYMLEVMWSTIPPCPPEHTLELQDPDYTPAMLMSVSPNSPSFAMKTQYAHLLAKRRRSAASVKEIQSARSPKVLNTPKSRSGTLLTLEDSCDRSLCCVQEDCVNEEGQQSLVSTLTLQDIGHHSNCNVSDEPVKQFADKVEKQHNPENMHKDVNTEKVENDLYSENVDKEHNEEKIAKNHNERINKEIDTESKDKKTSNDKVITGSSADDKVSCNTSNASSQVRSKSNSTDSDEGVSNISTESSNSSSYQSAPQSADERFPSLITASMEERSVFLDSETELISSSEGKIVVNNINQSPNRLGIVMVGTSSINQRQIDNEDQELFHLSLDETEKMAMKKPNVPLIKGSFFSGMKKILSSPKRKPVPLQEVHVSVNVSSQSNTKLDGKRKTEVNTTNDAKAPSKPRVDIDGENTLFEVNNMFRSLNAQHLVQDGPETDSGTGSFTSSTNSMHIMGTRNRSSSTNKGQMKPEEVLTKEDRDFIDQKYKETLSNKSSPNICSEKLQSYDPDHFSMDRDIMARSNDSSSDRISDCMEVTDPDEMKILRFKQLPTPDMFGYGNPFLMFLCLTVLLQHRDIIMNSGMEYDELAMYFDKMVRKHNVNKVLHQTRTLYTEYIRMQQRLQEGDLEEDDFTV